MGKAVWRALAAAVALTTAGWAGAADGPKGAETRKLCVSDLRQLLQIRHARASCSSFVVSDAPDAASITYDCAAAGNGRTDLRVETARLIQISSQGVADGAPFVFVAEGRRIGACR